MLQRLLTRLVLAILVLAPSSSWRSSESGSADRSVSKESIPTSQAQAKPGYLLLPDKVVDRGEPFLPAALSQRGIFLALSRWGSTTLALFDTTTKAMTPVATEATGELVASLAGGRIAYLVRQGVNPAKNYVEVLDLKRRKSQLIKPADDFAILGFTLSPSGEQLAYAQMNLRWSRSHRVSWRTGLADLRRYESRISLSSGQNNLSGEEILVPFAWSGSTGKIYLQGLLPFRGMATQGIWSMSPDGSGMRKILPEPSYTGMPRLSSDGTYLAYLSSRIEALPRDYIPRPGAPPGNILAVMSLPTGEQSILAQETDAVYGVFAWSATGKEILASHQEWLEGRFRDATLRRVRKGASLRLQEIARSQSLRVTGIGECSDGSLFWVEEDDQGARLLGAKANAAPATLLAFLEGKIELIGCGGE